jgi:hypothetical protein
MNMKRARLLQAFAILFTAALSMNCVFAADTMATPQVQPPKLMTSINIISTSIGSASPQNSNPVIVSLNVTNLVNRGICGLDASNFQLATITVPPYGPAVVITSLTQLDASRQPHICYYYIRVAPTSYQGTQYKWVKGTYNLRMDYLQNGVVAASKTFSLTV